MKQYEIIRVRFITNQNTGKLSRPTKVFKVTETVGKDEQKKEIIYYVKYNPEYKFSLKRLDESTFITKWESGPTPTKKPFRNCSDEELKAAGYSEEQFAELRGRKYSSKQLSTFRKKMGGFKKYSAEEARKELSKYDSYNKAIEANKDIIDNITKNRIKASKHVIYMGKYTHHRKDVDKEYKKIKRIKLKPNSKRYRKLVNLGVIDPKEKIKK